MRAQHQQQRKRNLVNVRPSSHQKEIEGHRPLLPSKPPKQPPPQQQQQQQLSFFDAQIENIKVPGLPCCTLLTASELAGFCFMLLYAAAAMMEWLQQRTFEPLTWAALLSVVVAFDVFWFVIYTLSKCRHSRQYRNLTDRHWKPSLHHLLIHMFIATIPAIQSWSVASYWTAEQFQLLQKRYEQTYPVGLDLRLFLQWQSVMQFIIVSLPIEILTWLMAMDRHWTPKYKKADPVRLLRGLQTLQNRFNPTAATATSPIPEEEDDDDAEEDIV